MARFIPYGGTVVVEGCECCMMRDDIQPHVRANTIAAYGLDKGTLGMMTLDSFQPMTERERTAKDAAEKVAARWSEGVGRSLWLWAALLDPPQVQRFGKQEHRVTGCGCGKTHLAVGLAKLALELGRTVKVVTENDLLDDIRASYGDDANHSEQQIVSELGQTWLLVLDDVGTSNVKSLGWYQSIMYGVIDKRYKAGQPIILTTNLAPSELAERLGTRIMSRLADMGVGVQLDGPDRRFMR